MATEPVTILFRKRCMHYGVTLQGMARKYDTPLGTIQYYWGASTENTPKYEGRHLPIEEKPFLQEARRDLMARGMTAVEAAELFGALSENAEIDEIKNDIRDLRSTVETLTDEIRQLREALSP